MSDSYTEHQAAIATAIAAVTGASMVTHYVVVAAVILADGVDTTATIVSPGLPLWQQHGLLSYEAGAATPEPAWALDEEEDS
ncbi:MAG: hypothetical protein M3Q39_16005 [Actinomycetota bacterium]|nr:hypothetical protein [Actinomycetota bacterium]